MYVELCSKLVHINSPGVLQPSPEPDISSVGHSWHQDIVIGDYVL